MPVQHRGKRAVIAVLHIAQHPADEPDIGELREPVGAAVALVHHVESFDVEAELGRWVDAFGDGRIEAVKTVEQEDLILLQFDRL